MNSFGISAALIIAIVCQTSSAPIDDPFAFLKQFGAALTNNGVGGAFQNALTPVGEAAGKTVEVATGGLTGTAILTAEGAAGTVNKALGGAQSVVDVGMRDGARNAENSMNSFNEVATRFREGLSKALADGASNLNTAMIQGNKNVNTGMNKVGEIAQSIRAEFNKAMTPTATSLSEGATAGNYLGQALLAAFRSFVGRLIESYQRNSDVINLNNNFNRMATDMSINANAALENIGKTAEQQLAQGEAQLAQGEAQISQVGALVADKVEGVAIDGTGLVNNLAAV